MVDFFSGKEEYKLEVNRTQLDELRATRNKANDRSRDRKIDM